MIGRGMSIQKSQSIFFVVPYPKGAAPGQRFRYEQYVDLLLAEGHQVHFFPFLSDRAWEVMYSPKRIFLKSYYLAAGMIKRVFLLFRLIGVDTVFIYREAAPLGPPLMEWMMAKIFRKKIIYDFDDAIWTTDKKIEPWLERTMRWRGKVANICRWSTTVSCGNEYLASYARKFNGHVVINPTTVDTDNVHNPELFPRKISERLCIGWTGSHSTLSYLESLAPVLKMIEAKHPYVYFLVIANKPPKLNLDRCVFKQWSSENEIKDLMLLDIGIMPLPDDEWTRGKCGFKAIQYMALEIPALVSPVSINRDIVEPGVTGFWCETETEWLRHIDDLVSNAALRKQLGVNGRKKVIANYSVASNAFNFLSIFE